MSNTLSSKEAAELLGVTPHTLAVWRCTGRYGLPYVKVGRLIRYRPEDLRTWLERNTRAPEVMA